MRKLPADKEIVKKIDEYIKLNLEALPILKECCLINNWSHAELTERSRLRPSVGAATARLQDQKEVNLEKYAVLGSFNKQMSAFLLEKLYENDLNRRSDNVLDRLDSLILGDIAEAEENFLLTESKE